MITLLEVVLRSSLLLLIGLALMPLLRRRSAALRHWVLFASVMSAGAVPLVSWVVPRWEALDVVALVPAAVVERAAPLAAIVTATPLVPDGAPAAHLDLATAPAWTELLLRVWLVGAALSLTLLLLGIARLHRLDAAAIPVTDGPWRDAAAHAASVRATRRRGLLLVWGWHRPSVIVPESALSWPRERVAVVMRHELAHVRRADWALQIAAEIIRAVYWFNPLVWLACARLRAECEIACDDAVIADGAAGADYAGHVVDIARELTMQHWLPAPAIVRRSTLERRVRAMLDKTRDRAPLSRRARNLAMATMLVATVTLTALAAQSFVSLTGTIVDPSNGVLPGVRLVLVNDQTQAKYEIKSDANGRYQFVGLPPGSYALQTDLPGFTRFTGRVEVGTQNVEHDLRLTLGRLTETITVRSGSRPTASGAEVRTVTREVMKKIEERQQRAVHECKSITSPSGVPIGGNIQVPLKLKDVKPIYPAAMQDTAGRVVLTARISPAGTVDDLQVVSSTHQEFTDSAIAAVSQWIFSSTVLNCQPVPVEMQVTATFEVGQ